jgi:5'-nucleotidase
VEDCSAHSEQTPDGKTRNFIVLDGPDAGEQGLGCHKDADCGSGGFCYNPGHDDAGVCKVKRYCTPRNVILAHSGAFAKYVGRLDLLVSNEKADVGDDYDPVNGFEVVTHEYQLFPVTENTPEDPIVSQILEPYHQGLDSLANLDLLVGYALDGSKRNSTSGGDSALGNLIASAMWLRLGIQTDFALTNSTGIRTDLVPGPVTVEQMFNIFPFDNSITKMQLSGLEVQDLFDFVARRSSGRGCVSQVQIAGARVVMDCTKFATYSPGKCTSDADCAVGINPLGVAQKCDTGKKQCVCKADAQCPEPMPGVCDVSGGLCSKSPAPGAATHIYIGTYQPPVKCQKDSDCPNKSDGQCDLEAGVCWQPIEPIAQYELATSNYLAAGGSGFRVLQRNTTQNDTKVQQRDALVDYIRAGLPCGADDNGELKACSADADCGSVGEGYICACPEAAEEGDFCSTSAKGCAGKGACVLAKCRDDVAAFQRATCEAAPTTAVKKACEKALGPCASGGEQCKFLACVDRRLGSFSDGRVKMVGQ